jgi:hypothetical protein
MRSLHQLLFRLYRARTRDHDQVARADLCSADIDNRSCLSQLAADELERVRDADYFGNARSCAQRFDFGVSPAASDRPDDGAFRTFDYVCLEATFFDSLNDMVDLVGGCVV